MVVAAGFDQIEIQQKFNLVAELAAAQKRLSNRRE